MGPPADLLAGFGIDESARLGTGGQSFVYALDAGRVLRILRVPLTDLAPLRRRQALLSAIDGRLAVATSVIEAIDPGGRWTIERRLPGRSMLDLLPRLAGMERETAVRSYMLAAEAPAAIAMPDRPYGQIIDGPPITAATWHDYLRASTRRFAMQNAATITAAAGDAGSLLDRAFALLDGVDPLPRKVLAHGDYFPGNVLLDDRLAVSGLVDFSFWTVTGDPLLDPCSAALCLEMVGGTTPADIALGRDLLVARHGAAARRAGAFYRAYFAIAMAEPGDADGLYPELYPWSVANLRDLATGRLAF